MAYHRDRLFHIAAVSAFALLPLTLDLSPARAQSRPWVGDVIKRSTTIASKRLQILPAGKSTEELSPAAVREQSMAYVTSGYRAEEEGNRELALEHYYNAVQVDPTNGWPFLLAGRLLGNNEIGIKCLNKAIELFTVDRDEQGYKLASELLQSAS
jgi:tetratricopeptide (TPR) repeat protein